MLLPVLALLGASGLLSLHCQAAFLPQGNVAPVAKNDQRQEVRQTSASQAPEKSPPRGMVLVPAGETILGIETDRVERLGDGNKSLMQEIAAETPRHVQTVETFFIDVTEVTNLQWKVYLEAAGRQPSEDLVTYAWPGGKIPAGEEHFPVTNVNMPEITDFLAWCGKRLPTEAEWTRAARGDDDRDYPWGAKWNSTRAQYAATVSPKPVAVTSFEEGASPYGVLNMAGNVFEWVDTEYAPFEGFQSLKFKVPGTRKTEMLTPPFDRTWKVLKGGCFASPREDLRIDRRVGHDPRASDAGLGFRTARSIRNGVEILAHGYRKLLPPQIPKRGDLDLEDLFAKEIISYLDGDGPPVVSGYRYLAFAHPGADKRSGLSSMRKEARDEPVTLGLIVTSEALEEPKLPPGQYVVAFKGEGESKAHKEQRRLEKKNGGDKPSPALEPDAGTTEAEAGGRPNSATAAFAPWPGVGAAEIVEDIDFPQDKDVLLYYNVNNAVVGWTLCPDITEEDHAALTASESNEGRDWAIEFSLPNPRSKREPRFTIPVKLAGPGLQ